MKIGVSSYSYHQLVRTGKMTDVDVPAKAKEMGFEVLEYAFLSPPKGVSLLDHAKRLRDAADLSQSQLAGESGVSLRSIQMYEQRNKDINKAQALTLAKIARVLGCAVEDLLESETAPDKGLI